MVLRIRRATWDLYVGKGELEGILASLNSLPDTNMVILNSSTRPVVEEHGAHPTFRNAVFYNNSAIDAMARIRFQTGGEAACYVDVMESMSRSPLMPILQFDLSHLRVAISAAGVFEFHPAWHQDNKTFAGPKGAHVERRP